MGKKKGKKQAEDVQEASVPPDVSPGRLIVITGAPRSSAAQALARHLAEMEKAEVIGAHRIATASWCTEADTEDKEAKTSVDWESTERELFGRLADMPVPLVFADARATWSDALIDGAHRIVWIAAEERRCTCM